MAAPAPYQLLPTLSAEEYAALEADIRQRGVMVPVEVDEEGRILDGHHRVAIATALGFPYRTIVRAGLSEAEKREHVLNLNLARRHMDAVRWGQAFVALLGARGIERGQGARNDTRTSATVADVAAELGVAERTARHRVAQADAYAALSEQLRAAVDTGEVTIAEATGIAPWPPPIQALKLADLLLDKAVAAYVTGLRDLVLRADELERRGAEVTGARAFLRRQRRRRLANPQAFAAAIAAAQARCRHLCELGKGRSVAPTLAKDGTRAAAEGD